MVRGDAPDLDELGWAEGGGDPFEGLFRALVGGDEEEDGLVPDDLLDAPTGLHGLLTTQRRQRDLRRRPTVRPGSLQPFISRPQPRQLPPHPHPIAHLPVRHLSVHVPVRVPLRLPVAHEDDPLRLHDERDAPIRMRPSTSSPRLSPPPAAFPRSGESDPQSARENAPRWRRSASPASAASSGGAAGSPRCRLRRRPRRRERPGRASRDSSREGLPPPFRDSLVVASPARRGRGARPRPRVWKPGENRRVERRGGKNAALSHRISRAPPSVRRRRVQPLSRTRERGVKER